MTGLTKKQLQEAKHLREESEANGSLVSVEIELSEEHKKEAERIAKENEVEPEDVITAILMWYINDLEKT